MTQDQTSPFLLPPNNHHLVSLREASALIDSGRFFVLGAEESLLRQLPRGNWIAGTIPYFMAQDGGTTTRNQIFISEVPVLAGPPVIREYDNAGLPRVCADAPASGFSLIILPAFSEVHSSFARNAPDYEEMFMSPLAGWVSGIHLDDLGKASPFVVNGQTGVLTSERAVVMHVPLPDDMIARIDILNVFKQGSGDAIRFPEASFSVSNCLINGRTVNFSDYLVANNVDSRLPLVADYHGAMVNVCVKGNDRERHVVDFYAPVFEDTVYRVAAPIGDYVQQFIAASSGVKTDSVVFSCNCVLNYMYSELEGKRTGTARGPMTFGEVAYQLLNQTLVYMMIERVGPETARA